MSFESKMKLMLTAMVYVTYLDFSLSINVPIIFMVLTTIMAVGAAVYIIEDDNNKKREDK